MDENKQHSVSREILLEEMETDIVMAKDGKIPPSLYQNRLQDLKYAMEKALISKQEYDSLSRRFQAAVKSAEQITDQAYAQWCMEESGGKILYYWQGTGNSVVMISRNGDDYFPVVYLDHSALGNRLITYSKQCTDELLAYAAAKKITPACSTSGGQVSCELPHFPSLEEALGYVITELNDIASHYKGQKASFVTKKDSDQKSE